MIGIEGQFILILDIGPVSDAIATEDLEYLEIAETTGTALPTFKLRFATNDEGVTPYLNEGNDIQISFGQTASDLHGCSVYLTQVEIIKEGDTRRHVKAEGLLAYPNWLVGNMLGITDEEDAVTVLKRVAAKYFTVDSNIDQSADKQHWIQHNVCDKRFANLLWLHAWLPDSWLAIGITAIDEQFRMRDVKKMLSQQPDWTFTYSADLADPKQIYYHGNLGVANKTGFLNAWNGYQRNYLTYDAQGGQTATNAVTVSPMLAVAADMPRRDSGVDPRFGEVAITSDNVHANFQQAFQRQTSYLTAFSAFGTELSFYNTFRAVKVLDLAYVVDDSTEAPKASASEYASGLYLVTGVCHIFTGRQYACMVNVLREAPGDVSGSFL